ncbi:hypothetical protein K504DRAFT_505968 [Pleomassaria siparia CBS 279.74]|uniref:Uncharacterized protein n=1 Tax=Pleomassaria siparia CBS 279.74 TaxID=1314801 RepID=A0A6G1JZ70_9PLEO|nr:hypothetical protein K504DRAFT_505968 [Pleomassaria siparia CBS 279.74]
MVAMYSIFGKQVGSHVLAIATLSTVGAVAYLSVGGSKPAESAGPAINAKSKEEESFIKYDSRVPATATTLHIRYRTKDFVKKAAGEKK